MKTTLQLCFGLLLAISAVGCHTCQTSRQSSCDTGCNTGCGHRSCLHKVVDKFKGGNRCNNCGSQGDCGCEQEVACECGRSHRVRSRSKRRNEFSTEASMYGYDKSVVYTGDDYQGIPQQMGMMPMSGGCAGCAGGAPMMSMPSTGCAGCGGSGVSPIPSEGGCASCGGSGQAPQPAAGGCASCGGNHPTPTPSVPPTSGGCASCGASATNDSFYNPMGPGHHSPAPAPPAEGNPAPMPEAVPGNNAAGSGDPIQKIHWVPRQL